MTNKNDVLENSIDPVRHFLLIIFVTFDDLSIITRLACFLLQCYLIV